MTICVGGMGLARADAVFFVPPDPAPSSISAGSVLHLGDGGALPQNFSATAGTTLHMRGGSIGNFAGSFGNVNISGGTLGTNFSANNGSFVAITGGTIGISYSARQGSTTLIGGGEIGLLFNSNSGADVRLFGTDFTLGGAPLNGLNQSGNTVVINDRSGQTLSGTLADGSPVSFVLNTFNFSSSSILSATLFLPGDFNRSGTVDQNDFTIWRNQFGTTVAQPGDGADGNLDGLVDAADFVVWRDSVGSNLSGAASLTATNVPEPGTLWVALLFATVFVLLLKPRLSVAERHATRCRF